MTLIIVCATIVQPVHAATYDKDFFSQNNILFYDTRCIDSPSDSRVQLAGNGNTEKILNFFMRKGLTLAQAAGIVGNMMQESGLNPAIIQGGQMADDSYTPVSGVGFGLVQWTSGGRQQNLVSYMKGLGVGMTDLSGQLGFAWKELSESYGDTLRKLKSASNPVDAAVAVHDGYEVSADSPDQVRSVRGGNAQAVYDKYKDAPALAGATASTEMTPSTGDGSTAVAATTLDGSSSPSCDSSGGAVEGDIIKTVQAYAWPTFTAGKTDQQPAYSAAVAKAVKEGRYVGGASGDDCGGFVTTLMYDSGFDKSYNSNAKGGNTISQEAWLKTHWKQVDANAPRQVGDVAINEVHTYVYVGKVPGFNSVIASASYPDRAPMAGSESPNDSSFRWYRKEK